MTTMSPPLSLSEVAYREMLSCVVSRLGQHAQTLEEHDCGRNPTFVAAISSTVEKLGKLDTQSEPLAVRKGFAKFAVIWREKNPDRTSFAQDLVLDVGLWLQHVDETLQLVDELCGDEFSTSIPNDE